MNEDEYFTNPNTRCKHCQGRAVTRIVGGKVVETNLTFTGSHWECIDKKECKQNQDAESTQVDFLFNKHNKIVGKRVSRNGKILAEVIKDGYSQTA